MGAGLGGGSICPFVTARRCSAGAEFSAYTSGSSVNLGTLTPSQTKTFKLRASAGAILGSGGTATCSGGWCTDVCAADPRTASDTNTITTSADLAVTKTGPSAAVVGNYI